jgi:hypothetical protein
MKDGGHGVTTNSFRFSGAIPSAADGSEIWDRCGCDGSAGPLDLQRSLDLFLARSENLVATASRARQAENSK